VTQAVLDYASFLKNQNIPKSVIKQSKDIIDDAPEVLEELSSTEVSVDKKHQLINSVFPKEIRSFFKLLADNKEIQLFPEIVDAYRELLKTPEQKELSATIRFVEEPDKEQEEKIKEFLEKEFNSSDMEIEWKKDKSIGNGFIIQVGNHQYDWSAQGRINQLKTKLQDVIVKNQANSFSENNVISMLRSEIHDFELDNCDKEIGVVNWVADGICNVDGIDHAFYGEIVVFENGVKGMVQDIRRDEIGCILFGRETEIKEGTRVARTGKMAGVPVGEAFKGRIINALGEPLDGKGEIASEGFRPIENPAPSIVERESVSVPMETGILSIDSMFPIGRGQRELIIGDRQTGKTSIATDTIINQKGKDVVCIYVAVGQKASTIAKLVNSLEKADAPDYTIIVSATAADPAPLQYIAPYAGTALAEYFMHKGKDVLVVYDDLSKHAVAYRAISLLLERSPGREAYPGDVFYLHSRLLERSSRLNKEAGGGSITALPIVETQAGDVSAYIPTNVISITDGQIFLETDLFNSGMRPAVNVGLSVSRVGGAAQTKAMKKAAGSLRIDLAQYREMEVFTQFSSDLDDATKAQLQYGKSLMELLKQPLGRPLSMAEQVISLVAGNDRLFTKVAVNEVKKLQRALLEHFRTEHSNIISELENTKILNDSTKEEIVDVAADFVTSYVENAGADK